MICSKRPAIGSNYLSDEVVSWHKKDNKTYVVNGGFKQLMPRYYRDKVFVSEHSKLMNRFKAVNQAAESDARYDKVYSEQIHVTLKQVLELLSLNSNALNKRLLLLRLNLTSPFYEYL